MTTTFDERYAAAKAIIDAHNAAVDKRGKGVKMSWQAFDDNLFDRGYTTVAALKRLTVMELMRWEVPEGLALVLTDILNPDASTTPTAPSSPSSPPLPAPPSIFGQTVTMVTRAERIAALPIEQIVASYDPRDPDNVFGTALIKKVRIARCVVFNNDGTVNRAATTRLVEEIIARKPERKTWTDATGDIYPVYQIGVLPVGEDMIRICPIHRCELRDDGECTAHDESWAGVPEIAQQLFALGMETGDLAVKLVAGNPMELRRTLVLFQGKGDDEVLKLFGSLMSKSLVIAHNERKATHQPLPTLRVPRSQLESATGSALGGSFGNPALNAFVMHRKAGEPKAWDRPHITKFRKLLERFYPDERRAREIVARASIDAGRCDFSGGAQSCWCSVMDEVERSPKGTMDRLLACAKEDYGSTIQQEGF